jgi:hypothetical protein
MWGTQQPLVKSLPKSADDFEFCRLTLLRRKVI